MLLILNRKYLLFLKTLKTYKILSRMGRRLTRRHLVVLTSCVIITMLLLIPPQQSHDNNTQDDLQYFALQPQITLTEVEKSAINSQTLTTISLNTPGVANTLAKFLFADSQDLSLEVNKLSHPSTPGLTTTSTVAVTREEKKTHAPSVLKNVKLAVNPAKAKSLSGEVEVILSDQRKLLAKEMGNSSFARSLSDLVPELGGTPIRSLVVTSWRSGSTFLGDVLNSHPGNWYHYEPLLDFGVIQVRNPPSSHRAIANLTQMLNCNYTGLDLYLNRAWRQDAMFKYNTRLWSSCGHNVPLCYQPQFLNPLCRIYPLQSMKLVRLRLRLAETFLQDTKLNVRMVLLVRDPRGTMSSRMHRAWCSQPDCSNTSYVCQDLVDDFHTARKFVKKYPRTFTVLRYEDLSLHPEPVVRGLFNFLGREFSPAVQFFVDSHTKVHKPGPYATFRKSQEVAFEWQRHTPHEKIKEIQQQCSEAMRLWGYLPTFNATHQKQFNPLTSYSILSP